MCGINIIVFYFFIVFIDVGVDKKKVFFVFWGFGLVNFFFVFLVIWIIDIFGC